AAWNGSGAAARWAAPTGWGLDAIAWCEVTTFASVSDAATGDLDIVMTSNPGGFNYTWTPLGTDGSLDCSPPAFGHLGPNSIQGNMLAFAGGGGLYTAFPYFADSFLVPEQIPGTAANDWQPHWSPLFADGELWLAFIRNYEVWVTEVYASGGDNAWTAPVRIYGASADDATAMRIAWAPETSGAPDRLAVVEHHLFSSSPLYEAGDIVVLTWNHATGTFSGAQLAYDASANGGVKARDLAWR
ncbi:MAG TPA: hypothetical protein VLS93_06665, partial [Anaeromyxobacteraceae bacterium]|nr:hypothetical protein [Anaeromyxobacteraceae bacterium]